MLKRLLRRDEKGLGAVEFALVAPVMIAFIVGVSQVGRLFYANADMKNAIAHGARLASLYPAPTEDAPIIAAVNARLMREGAVGRATTTVVRGADDGNPFIEVRITYSVPLEFIFFSTPAVTLSDSRRVYTQVENPLENNADGDEEGEGGSSTSSTTSSGDPGTTSASSTTSSGDPGTTSASSTSTSSGTTSSTSTSSTSTTSSTSSGNNGSNGNGSSGNNNGSSGHAHGNCNHNC